MGCGEEGAELEKWRRQSRIAQSRIKWSVRIFGSVCMMIQNTNNTLLFSSLTSSPFLSSLCPQSVHLHTHSWLLEAEP